MAKRVSTPGPPTVVVDTHSATDHPNTSLIPVPKWNDYHDWPPQGGMRHLIFNSKTNGFNSAFKRIGRRVLVDEAEFFRCVARLNRKGA